ncbi:MAG: ThaI family type II restriction endonuclease [Promethearchaeota archaeon]
MGFDIIFNNIEFINKIKKRLPKLIYDLDSAFRKGGKLSPDIGNLREKMMIGILKKQYPNKIKYNFESQESELDFKFEDENISFKTSISKRFKLIWTANYRKAIEFYENFIPSCSIILLLFQKKARGLYYFLLKLLIVTHNKLNELFLKKPKKGTNPRGVELSTKAFNEMIKSPLYKKISIDWENIEKGPSTAIDFIDFYYNLW